MAKRVSLLEFTRILDKNVHYPKNAIKELAKHKGYMVPKEFWEQNLVGKARYAVIEVVKNLQSINKDDFIVDIEHLDNISTNIEVKRKSDGESALTTICYGMDTEPYVESLMRMFK